MPTSVPFGLQWGARADHAVVANSGDFCVCLAEMAPKLRALAPAKSRWRDLLALRSSQAADLVLRKSNGRDPEGSRPSGLL